jgi:serine/threonine protein kinase
MTDPLPVLPGFTDLRFCGKGGSSTIFSAVHTLSGETVAIKLFGSPVDPSLVNSEFEIHRDLDHPFIAHYFGHLNLPAQRALILEFVDGRQLVDHVNEFSRLREYEAQPLFCEIVSAVHYLHTIKHIVHRDLKLDNLLLTRQNHIKLIDFGFAYRNTGPATDPLLSFPYGAPEIFRGSEYDSAIDIWSLGVILYVMVCGDFPFGSDSLEAVSRRVLTNPTYPDHISRDLRDLLQAMLATDPKSRPDISAVKAHPWLQISRYALLMGDELVNSPAVRTIPLSSGEVDSQVAEIMRRKGMGEVQFAELGAGESEQGLTYRILRTMAVQRVLPSYCQSVLMQRGLLRPKAFKSNSVALPNVRVEAEGSLLVEKPLPPLAVLRPAMGRSRQTEIVRPAMKRGRSMRVPMSPEPRFLGSGLTGLG